MKQIPTGEGAAGTLQALRRFASLDAGATAVERCQLCHAVLDPRHEHLLEPDTRDLRCACTACALLFAFPGARRVRVAHRAERLHDVHLDDSCWATLGVPAGLAFFTTRGATGEIFAYLPGAGGATATRPRAEAWTAVCEAHPAIADIPPDVEALLVHRVDGASEHWRVSIDLCHRLVALLRLCWRGPSGGPEARALVARFFAELGGGARG